MTIATGAQALASDLLKAHNASGYLDLATSTELTISGGIVTQTQNWHRIDTEADASSDNLDTITAAASTTDGFLLVIRAENTARSIVIKHNTGNIYCPGATDITLDDVTSCVLMVYDATLVKWVVAASFQTTTGSGTGVADRVVLWASSTTLDSDANLTFDGTTLLLGSGQAITAGTRALQPPTPSTWTTPTTTCQRLSERCSYRWWRCGRRRRTGIMWSCARTGTPTRPSP